MSGDRAHYELLKTCIGTILAGSVIWSDKNFASSYVMKSGEANSEIVQSVKPIYTFKPHVKRILRGENLCESNKMSHLSSPQDADY